MLVKQTRKAFGAAFRVCSVGEGLLKSSLVEIAFQQVESGSK